MKKLGLTYFFLAGLSAAIAAAQALGVVVENYMARNVFGKAPSGVHDTVDTYRVQDLICTAWLEPPKVTEEPGTAGNFFTVLTAQFPPGVGRIYTSLANPLSAGTLKVHTYDVQGTPTRVGAEIDMEYAPGVIDPQNDMHWIQVVTDNHDIVTGGGHGVNENIVDINRKVSITKPYYDTGFAANSGNCLAGCDFYDFSGRGDAQRAHTWVAVNHLVVGSADGLGEIKLTHPGFVWGWKNVCVPAPVGKVYRSVPSNSVRLGAKGEITPGALVDLTVLLPAEMTLTKGTRTATVALTGASLQIDIDESIDAAGMSAYTLRAGQGQFEPYVFGDESIGVSTFMLESGDGWIQWQGGEISAHVTFRVSTSGFPDVVGVADGTGRIDFQSGVITVDPDSMGLENVAIAAIPTASTLGLLILAVLLLVVGLWMVRWH